MPLNNLLLFFTVKVSQFEGGAVAEWSKALLVTENKLKNQKVPRFAPRPGHLLKKVFQFEPECFVTQLQRSWVLRYYIASKMSCQGCCSLNRSIFRSTNKSKYVFTHQLPQVLKELIRYVQVLFVGTQQIEKFAHSWSLFKEMFSCSFLSKNSLFISIGFGNLSEILTE